MKLGDQRTFQHTSIAAYLLATAALGCLFYDSTKVVPCWQPVAVTMPTQFVAVACALVSCGYGIHCSSSIGLTTVSAGHSAAV